MSSIRLPHKYHYLQQAAAAGIRIPRSLLLVSEQAGESTWQGFVAAASRTARFIVRSANPGEDGHQHSRAGHFWSSPPTGRAGLAAQIGRGWAENRVRLQALGRMQEPCLLLQEYVEHELGGVLFTPWSFFPDYAALEFSDQGAAAVVQGLGQSALIALSPQGEAPLPLPDALVFLMPALQALCRALKAVFDFALDMEWAWDHQARQVVLLQVRPQTHAVGPLLPLPTGVPVVREAGNWRYTALSESLGRLSPLSFSLLQHLYQALIPDLRALGYRAGAVDFLQRLPDGAVLVDSGREQAFYAPTRLGGFWKGFRAPALRQQALNTLHNWHREAGFSAETLAALFRVWMVANLLAAGAGRATSLPPHAYELSWLAGTPDSTLPLPVLQPDWPGINTRAQQLFLYELEKLKCELARYPEQVFCHWGEFVCAEVVDQAGLHERQRVQVRQALYDHVTPVLADGALRDSRFVALAALSVAEGPALVVANPASQPAVFPTGSILLAPYFDNRWVGAMTGLHGVVVRQGSRLSHSAIVAREQGIPYCVMPGLDLQAFASGRLLRLDAIRQTLTTAAVRELN